MPGDWVTKLLLAARKSYMMMIIPSIKIISSSKKQLKKCIWILVFQFETIRASPHSLNFLGYTCAINFELCCRTQAWITRPCHFLVQRCVLPACTSNFSSALSSQFAKAFFLFKTISLNFLSNFQCSWLLQLGCCATDFIIVWPEKSVG